MIDKESWLEIVSQARCWLNGKEFDMIEKRDGALPRNGAGRPWLRRRLAARACAAEGPACRAAERCWTMKSRSKVIATNLAGTIAVEARTDHVFPRHMHAQFGIGLIEAGAQKSLSGRGMVEAAQGDVITVNPGEVHDGAPIGDQGRAWRMLYFDPDLIFGLRHDMTEGQGGAGEFSHPVLRDSRLAGTFLALYGAVSSSEATGSSLETEELLFGLLASLMRCDTTSRGAVPGAMLQVRQRIADDPAANLTLAALAAERGLSRFQVVRGFKNAFGLGPHAYLTQCRADLARRLIACGVPLAEAAVASGFSDQSHMTRHFTRNFGISPGALGRATRCNFLQD